MTIPCRLGCSHATCIAAREQRDAIVAYLRLMADGLKSDVAAAASNVLYTRECRLLLRDAALLESTAADIDNGLHHDPVRLAELKDLVRPSCRPAYKRPLEDFVCTEDTEPARPFAPRERR